MGRPESELNSPGVLPAKSADFQRRMGTLIVLFASFLACSFIRTPIPAVNEPHYLAKAKHFWDPDWCRGDLFLESSNPHFVYYTVVGSLTTILTLEQTAAIARVAGLLILAVGFQSLLSTALRTCSSVVWATWFFLGFSAIGNFSGEWVVGGIEGKVFAYGFAFWGAGLAANSRPKLAGACLGLGISFHPVVGIWCTAATILAVSVPRLLALRQQRRVVEMTGEIFKTLPAAICLTLCALPGLIPAFQTLGGAPPDIIRQAEVLQVFVRLGHHLNPAVFSPWSYAGYGALLLGWFLLRRRANLADEGRFMHWYLIAATLIASGGLVVGLVLKYPSLMKFYPFRLFDVVAPLAVAIALAGLLQPQGERPRNKLRIGLAWGLTSAAMLFALSHWPKNRDPSPMQSVVLADWIGCCRWISEHAPQDAQVLTPSYSWAFKWYGERAEYVNYKDCPQDARSLLEWKHRWDLLRAWEHSRRADSMSQAELDRFSDHALIDLVIAWPNDQTDLRVAYQGKYFAVYEATTQKNGRRP